MFQVTVMIKIVLIGFQTRGNLIERLYKVLTV